MPALGLPSRTEAIHLPRLKRLRRVSYVVASIQQSAQPSLLSRRSACLLTGGAAGFACGAQRAKATAPNQGLDDLLRRLEDRVSEFTLQNELHFIVLERHTSPVVSCHTYADVGAFYEPAGQTGIAHLLEHMAFKGTERIGTRNYRTEAPILDALDEVFYSIRDAAPEGQVGEGDTPSLQRLSERFAQLQAQADELTIPNQFGALLQRAGGVGLNASTSPDATRYFVSLPTNALELWFALEAERFQAPVFRELYSEKKVVAEERRARVDNSPLGRFVESFCDAAFANAYAHPTIGWPEDVARLGRRELQAFFTSHYNPRRLTIAIVGDVDPGRVQMLADKYFGGWQVPSMPADAVPPSDELLEERIEGLRPQGRPTRLELASPAGPAVMQAYYRPGMASKDALAIDVIGELLSGSRTSRLQQRLVDGGGRQALVASCSRAFPGEKHGNAIILQGVPAPGVSLAELEQALSREAAALADRGPRPQELQRLAKAARLEVFDSMQSNSSMASALCSYHALTRSWRTILSDIPLLEALSSAIVRDVAAKLFTSGNCFTGIVNPSKKM